MTWEGSLEAPATGDYQFQSYANGGIKIWIDAASFSTTGGRTG